MAALLLSGFPLLLLGFWENWTHGTDGERHLENWQREARIRLEEFRSLFPRHQQYSRFLKSVDARLRRSLPPKPEDAILGAKVVEAVHASLPASFRPQGTRVYAFSFANAASPRLLRNPGLQEQFGGMLARLFGDLAKASSLSLQRRRELDKRLSLMFGPLVSGELLERSRRVMLIRALFDRAPVALAWDWVFQGEQVVGAYLLIFSRLPSERACLAWALHQTVWKGDAAFVPALLPIETIPAGIAPVTLPGTRSDQGLQKALGDLKGVSHRDRVASVSQALDRGDHLLFRSGVSARIPYELLLVGPATPRTFPWTLAATILWASLWLSGVAWRYWRGDPFRVSLHMRMMVLLLLLGGIPLVGLILAGSVRIERAHDRRVREAVDEVRNLFAEIDANSVNQLSRLVARSRDFCLDPQFQEALLDSGVTHESPAIAGCFKRMAREGLPLESIMLAQYDGRFLVFRPSGGIVQEDDPARLFFSPWLYGPVEFFSPVQSEAVLKTLTETVRLAFKAYGLILSGGIRKDLALLRQRGISVSFGDRSYFLTFDFLGREDHLAAGILFRVDAEAASIAYARQALRRESIRRPGKDFSVTWTERGRQRFDHSSPRPDTVWNERQRVGFLGQVAISQANQTRRRGDHLLLGSVCRYMKGVAFAGAVDLTPLRRRMETEYRLLRAGAVLLAAVLLLIGATMTGYFLSPLAAIREGLQEILARRLDVRLNVARADELGEVAARFDLMAQGLQERAELARFVSGALASDLQARSEFGVSSELRPAAVLASDIRGFTTLTESNPAPDVVSMLNRHLEVMSEAIVREGGQIDKFIGDAVVASFCGDSPTRQVERAIAAGRAMMSAHRDILCERQSAGLFGYGMGVGISFGEVLVGSFGSDERREFALLGEPRQEAEEMEALSKLGRFTRIILAERAAALASGTGLAPLPDSPHREVVEL